MTRSEAGAPRAPSPLMFILLALLVPALLVALALFIRGENARADRERAMFQASTDITAAALQLRATIRQAETAQRGFILTRNARYLAPYAPARAGAAQMLGRYRALTGDAATARIVVAKFAEMERVLAFGRAGRWDRAIDRISDGEGLALMGRIEARMQAQIDRGVRIAETNRALLTARTRSIERLGWVIIALVTIALVVGLAMLWRLRRDRWAAALAAHEAATRHATIFESASDAILILNPSGSIEQANRAALTMLGYSHDDLARRDVARVLDIAPGEGTFHDRVGVQGDGLRSAVLIDRTAQAADGREIAVDVSLGTMQLPDGLHVVAAMRDVSQRRAVERMKDEFLATVSHELRTPLTSVVGSLGLLRAGKAGDLPDAARELIEIAESNTRRLIRLTNDVLDLEKLNSHAMKVEREPLDLSDIAEETIATYRAAADGRNIQLEFDRPAVALPVEGDRQRLLQVAGNLLSNAIRHAPADSRVTISTARTDGRAVLRVRDRGAGVPIEFRDRIFDRFGQAPTPQSGGTGLGLAIAREIMALHDGSIWYEEADDGGAIFAFALDRARLPDGAATVLLLSRDRTVIDRLDALVGASGFRLRVASSIEAFERDLHDEPAPALLLFDLDLAVEEQIAFWAWLNTDPSLGPSPRAVVSSALVESEVALPFDIAGWFAKPIDAEALRALLREPPVRGAGAGAMRILHVEDDRDLCAVMRTALRNDGEVLSAHDLASAHRMLAAHAPDIVILDLDLPDGAGVDLLPALINADGRPIPVVVHSAQSASEAVVARAAAVVTKSRASLPELQAILRSIARDKPEAR